MAFKVKTVSQIVNPFGFNLSNCVFSIVSVLFDFREQRVVISWELTPANWIQGMPTTNLSQVIPVDLQNQTLLGLILQNSDQIHSLSMDIAFIETNEGLKSFQDLNAQTVEV